MTIFNRNNVIMKQLSPIVSMELKMLHLTVRNMIVSNLYGTLIITKGCSRGLNRKSKLAQNLMNPNCFNTWLNDVVIFFFCSRQRDYLMFLARPHQRSSAIAKHIPRSGRTIIFITSPVRSVNPTRESELQQYLIPN
jgi:hypothetical protein